MEKMWKGKSSRKREIGEEKSERDVQRLKNIIPKVSEESRIMLDGMIEDFATHPNVIETTLPKELTNTERAYIHYQASKNGFKSFSSGIGSERCVSIRRILENTMIDAKCVRLTDESLNGISMLMNDIENQETRDGLIPHYPQLQGGSKINYVSRLSSGPFPKIPKPRRNYAYFSYQRDLPIWQHREEILRAIDNHRVVFIRGSTGCGKTTQVGQYILEDAQQRSGKVRIFCTVPRRIAAISVSERVAQERGEKLGQTVGYQIRLESCMSPVETLLTYCTSGVLLRSLSAPDYSILRSCTHIIIDEIHERDRQTDFLLACLKGIVHMFPHVKLILMGADLNDELFSKYFDEAETQVCPVIRVNGSIYPVQEYFLEDVLELTKYTNSEMNHLKEESKQERRYGKLLDKLQQPETQSNEVRSNCNGVKKSKNEIIARPDVDATIQNVWSSGDEESFAQFLALVRDDCIPVDYQHSSVGVSMLMASAAQGNEDYVSILLEHGADVNVKTKMPGCEFNAIEWASDHNRYEVYRLMLEHKYKTMLMPKINECSRDSEKYRNLATYLKSVDEERVDLLLILHLIHQIHTLSNPKQAILVFLPGYDEIVTLKHLILNDEKYGFIAGSLSIFMLHSNIQTGDQRAAFERPGGGVRKIVLSTNIAETSLTIEDIVFVIDSGKAKEKSFDSMTGVTQLKSVWISKASVNQRRGRAGRCQQGVCYHLFSSSRYEAMVQYPIPEIVRTSLQELCLQARNLIKIDLPIETFFTKIPEPPAHIAVMKSVDLLKEMGALDDSEELTKLGFNLLDFPLEPFLGKALIYAVVFKCLDPIMTLVSVISYRDPFQLPSDPSEKKFAHDRKLSFSRKSFSDHMVYLKAFQDWEKAKMFQGQAEWRFCRENYLSPVTFDMIYGIRSQLLGQLRASGFVKTRGVGTGSGGLKDLNQNSHNWALVKGILVATLYPNICGIDREKKVLYNNYNSKVSFHPSTVVAKKTEIPHVNVDWIVFDEMSQQGTSKQIKGCTCVSSAAVALFAGKFDDNESIIADYDFDLNDCKNGIDLLNPTLKLQINSWISMYGNRDTIERLVFLRKQIKRLIMKRLDYPLEPFTVQEEQTIETIATLLTKEDKDIGFENVEGIGQWPKFVTGNLLSAPRTGYQKTSGSISAHDRFFIIELDNIQQAVEIMKSRVWLLPECLSGKFCDEKEMINETIKNIAVFLWLPLKQQFAGAIKFCSSSPILPEVPVEIISAKVISLTEGNIDPTTINVNLNERVNGMELDFPSAKELLNALGRY